MYEKDVKLLENKICNFQRTQIKWSMPTASSFRIPRNFITRTKENDLVRYKLYYKIPVELEK